jgi:hypothetical protein
MGGKRVQFWLSPMGFMIELIEGEGMSTCTIE